MDTQLTVAQSRLGTTPMSGLRILATAAIAAVSAVVFDGGSAALAQTSKSASKGDRAQPAPVPANIDRNGVLILVRTAILALDHANKSGNYTVLRDLGSPGFQKNSAADLAHIFAPERQQGLDLAAVAVLEPQLTLLPQIEPNGMLHMAGFFPSVPMQVNFELLFAPVDRQWKLFGVAIDLGQAGPKAPETAPEPEPEISLDIPDPPTPEVNPRRLAEQP